MWILAVLFRPARAVLLGILAGLIVLGVIYGPWVAAQARAVGTLTTAYETPLLSWVTRKLTDEPRLQNTTVAGTAVTIVEPSGEGPWYTVLLINGATEAGRFDNDLLQLATGLARVGHRVAIVDGPDPESGDLSASAEEDTMRVARALAGSPSTRDGEVSLIGLGFGGTLALVAAEDRSLATNVPLVVAVSPLTDLVELGRLVTTGFHATEEGFTQLPVPRELLDTAANVLVDALPRGPTRDLLAAEIAAALAAEAEDGPRADPFAALDDIPDGLLDADAQAMVDLLANDDPEAYDILYRALPDSTRRAIERLSPAHDARRLTARVELAVASDDPLVPFAQAQALEQTAPDMRITVSDAFSSIQSQPGLGSPVDYLRIDALLVRALHEIRNG